MKINKLLIITLLGGMLIFSPILINYKFEKLIFIVGVILFFSGIFLQIFKDIKTEKLNKISNSTKREVKNKNDI